MLTKKSVLAVVAIFQCAVLYWIYSTHEAEHSFYQPRITAKVVQPEQQLLIRDNNAIVIGDHVMGDCTQMGDMDLKVIYTLWGNINMPVHTITCSAPKRAGSKYFSISNVFFTRHKDERPMVKFDAAKAEKYYTLILSEANVDLDRLDPDDTKQELLKWVVLNINGEDLDVGIEEWVLHGSEILDYMAPKVKEGQHEAVFQFVVFQQKEFIKTFNSEILINENKFHCEEFIKENKLSPVARVAFSVIKDL